MIEEEKHIISNDGTRIGYRQIGKGEGLIIVHGTGRISQNYRNLAASLSHKFTVYTADRRGRGLSGGWTKDHSLMKEVEDLITLVRTTKSRYIFGHSFGGVIALGAAMYCDINKLVVYEPPISINNSIPSDWLPSFEKAIAKNEKIKAMAIFLKALPPPNIDKLPVFALMILGNVVKFLERKKENSTKMLNLLYTVPPDMKIVKELDSTINDYKNMTVKTLLLGGTNSQIFFQQSVEALSKVLPDGQSQIFDQFDHYSPEEKYEEIADVLINFFISR